MTDREFEQMLEQSLQHDYSVGTEAFRDELLERCLTVLGAGDEGRVIADDDLEMLAAAGDVKLGIGGQVPETWDHDDKPWD